MSQQIEIEYKNLVTKDEFEAMKRHFQIEDEAFILQTNDYFDTPAFSLKQASCALRIRNKKGKYEFTLKEPQEIGLLETTDLLSEQQVEALFNNSYFPQGEVYKQVVSLGVSPEEIIHFGSLHTWRFEFPYKNGLLVLDKSSYLETMDYELEYEVVDPEEGAQNFKSLLELFQIPIRETKSKIMRFYQKKMFLRP